MLWLYALLFLAPIWVLLIWLLVLPALIKHLRTARGLGEILLYLSQFLFTPLTLVVILMLGGVAQIMKFILGLLKAALAVVLMLLLIVSAPIVFLVERFNLKPGWLIEQWLKVGDFVLDLIHKLFTKAITRLGRMIVPSTQPMPPPQSTPVQNE